MRTNQEGKKKLNFFRSIKHLETKSNIRMDRALEWVVWMNGRIYMVNWSLTLNLVNTHTLFDHYLGQMVVGLKGNQSIGRSNQSNPIQLFQF